MKQAVFLIMLLTCACTTKHPIPEDPTLPVIISSDRGGKIHTRLSEIRTLKAQNRDVKITGNICYSTCTMFLDIATCVSPNTIFGFHGPSSYGKPLEETVFETASEIIAQHYPESLKTWYMTKARHDIIGIQKLTGLELNQRHNIALCET